MSNEVTKYNAIEIIDYNVTEEAIAKLKEEFSGITVNDNKTLDVAKKARMTVVKLRTSVEAMRKGYKQDALEYGRKVDAEAKRVTALLEEVEEPLDSQIKIFESEQARIKAEKIAAEATRIATIQARIAEFNNLKLQTVGKNSSEINALVLELSAAMLSDVFDYQEFKALADASKAVALDDLNAIFDKITAQEAEIAEREAELKAQREAEAAKIAAEYERIERHKQEQAEAEAKRLEDRKIFEAEKKKLEEERAAEAARLQAESDKLEQEKAAHAQAQAAEHELKLQEQAQLDAERQKIADERAALEADKAKAEAEKDAEIRTPVGSIKIPDAGIPVTESVKATSIPTPFEHLIIEAYKTVAFLADYAKKLPVNEAAPFALRADMLNIAIEQAKGE